MKKAILYTFALLLAISSVAQIPEKPEPPTLVNDFAGVFSNAERNQLEQRLVDFFAQSSNQIAVVTVPDLQGYDISDFAVQLGEKWGIGSKADNGVLILIKPKTAEGGGKVFIAVGYGLEGAIPDITSKRIVENEIIPRFKQGDMYGGVDQAIGVLASLAQGEYNYQQYAKKASGKGGFNPFIILVVLAIVFSIFKPRRRGMYTAGGSSSLPFWMAMGMMGGANRNHSGMFGNFSGGSGSFGGGGSSFGSFGGFGGGSFGGGGAGGSW